MSLPVSDCRRATSEISLEYFENEYHSVTNAHPPPPTFCVPLVHSSIRSYYLRIANSFFLHNMTFVCVIQMSFRTGSSLLREPARTYLL